MSAVISGKTRHPLSEAFGDIPPDQFAELVADIKKNGLLSAIVTSEDGRVLDGWHRLRACVEAGIKPRFEPFNYVVEPAAENVGRTMSEAEFVVSQNAHRRHLTAEQKRALVLGLLRATPGASDRVIARAAKVDHKTVSAARRKAEATGEVPQLNKTTGADGRTRKVPAKKVTSAPTIVAEFQLNRGTPKPEPKPALTTDAEDIEFREIPSIWVGSDGQLRTPPGIPDVVREYVDRCRCFARWGRQSKMNELWRKVSPNWETYCTKELRHPVAVIDALLAGIAALGEEAPVTFDKAEPAPAPRKKAISERVRLSPAAYECGMGEVLGITGPVPKSGPVRRAVNLFKGMEPAQRDQFLDLIGCT